MSELNLGSILALEQLHSQASSSFKPEGLKFKFYSKVYSSQSINRKGQQDCCKKDNLNTPPKVLARSKAS
jgi:hypothetical protein